MYHARILDGVGPCSRDLPHSSVPKCPPWLLVDRVFFPLPCVLVLTRIPRYHQQEDTDNPVTLSFTQKSGNQLDVKIGLERFHAPELFFKVPCWLIAPHTAVISPQATYSINSRPADPLLKSTVISGCSVYVFVRSVHARPSLEDQSTLLSPSPEDTCVLFS